MKLYEILKENESDDNVIQRRAEEEASKVVDRASPEIIKQWVEVINHQMGAQDLNYDGTGPLDSYTRDRLINFVARDMYKRKKHKMDRIYKPR